MRALWQKLRVRVNIRYYVEEMHGTGPEDTLLHVGNRLGFCGTGQKGPGPSCCTGHDLGSNGAWYGVAILSSLLVARRSFGAGELCVAQYRTPAEE